jgi:myo-inositol-1(or 4)-monophosphatase
MHEPSADLTARYTLAKSLAREAGAFAHAYFKRRSELVVESKGTQDEVSIADRETEIFIREGIRQAFPNDGILGEEGADESAGHRIIWVIDPIDGTACFVNGMFSWCVSIAVLVDGVASIGAVFDPNANELFHAVRDGGAFVNDQPIRVKAASDFRAGLMGTSLSHRLPPEGFIRFLGALLQGGGMFIRNGSGALSICYVAAGRFIGFYEPHINSWDCLAGIVIAVEAGARCNDFLANNGLYEGNPLIVASAALSPILSETIANANLSTARV